MSNVTTQYKDYGHFSEDKTEFIITRPDTPRPWINYLSNGEYCVLISQTGGGFSFYKDPDKNRITRWSPENYLHDKPGRYLYLRDEESGEYWSATYQPVRKSDHFEAVHGLGYTTIKNTYSGIASEVTCFVPPGTKHEQWLVRISNTTQRPRRLTVYPFIEWLLGSFFPELSMRNISILLNEGHYDKKNRAILATKFPLGNKPWEYSCFMASSLPVKGYDLDYEAFMGRYRDHANPEVVEQGKCRMTDNVRGLNLVGVFESALSLAPGKTKEFSVIIGIEKKGKSVASVIRNARDLKKVQAALDQTKAFWRKEILENVTITTPDKNLDTLTNVWAKYQVYMCNHWGRSATFYHEGHGEFGYRNTAQDAFGMLTINARYARQRLLKLAQHQKASGQCMAGWSEEVGPSLGRPTSDFPAWLPFLINDYAKESGDFDLLNQQVPYFDGGSATLYEHGLQGMRFLQDHEKGEHGLPLMGTQDWNDALDRVGIGGKGESVMLAMQVCWGLKNLEEIAAFLGDDRVVKECRQRYESMKQTINQTAWDGNWYLMAYDDEMRPLGTRNDKENQVYLNTQSFAIMAGIPDAERLKKVLATVKKRFADPYGPPLFVPYYGTYHANIGRITAFAPGTKENAAIFCHAGTFMAYAYLTLGMADEACDIFNRISPIRAVGNMEIYRSEPYVFPEYITGPGNVRYGEGAFTWLTGTCNWFLVAVTQQLLGVKPEYAGLRINPCLPTGWKKAHVDRIFRGTRYSIDIVLGQENRIYVNGQPIEGNLVKMDGHKNAMQVKAVLSGPAGFHPA